MFKGSVSFVARIKWNGLKFPLVEFNPNEVGVEKVEFEGQNGDEIRTTVYLTSVASCDEGRALAAKVITKGLDRISIFRNLVIENARINGDQFSSVNSKPGVLEITVGVFVPVEDAAKVVPTIPPAELKIELEQPSPPGEQYFGLFRSARQSTGPVEEFMHLYHILLWFYNDKQFDVDAFIRTEDPTVPQTQHPMTPGAMETVYTRLRNELGHKRKGVNLDKTKAEMANFLGGLIALTKRAIELHP